MTRRRIKVPVITIGIWTRFYIYFYFCRDSDPPSTFVRIFLLFFFLVPPSKESVRVVRPVVIFRCLVFRKCDTFYKHPLYPYPIIFVRAPRRRKIVRRNAVWNVQIPPTEASAKQINLIFSKISIVNPCRRLTPPSYRPKIT